MRRNMKQTHRVGYFWPDGSKFTALPEDFFCSEAFRSLSASAALVLPWMVRRYYQISKNESLNLASTGFTFTWKHMEGKISENTFGRAVKEICQKGFFTCDPKLQPIIPGQAKLYAPSRNWCSWKDETGALHEHTRKKTKRRQNKSAALLNSRIDTG